MINTEAFVLFAGMPSSWDAEIVAMRQRQAEVMKSNPRLDRDVDLFSLQVSQWRRGRRSAELSENIYGWCVRSGMGFDNWRRISPNFKTMNEAIAWGCEWAMEEPQRREFYARKSSLPMPREIDGEPDRLAVDYLGLDQKGRRRYLVAGRAYVVAVDEEEWQYECAQCANGPKDCEHVEAVCMERNAFENADEEMGRGM